MPLQESTLDTIRSYASKCAKNSKYGQSCTDEQLSELIESIYQAGVQTMRDSQAAKVEPAKVDSKIKIKAERFTCRGVAGTALIGMFPEIFEGLTFEGLTWGDNPLTDAVGFPYIQALGTDVSPEKRSIAIMDDASHMIVVWLLSIIALAPSIMIDLAESGVDNPQSRVSSLLDIAWATLQFMNDSRVLDGALAIAYAHFHKFGKYCEDGAPLDKSPSDVLGPEGLALLDCYTTLVKVTGRDDIVVREHPDWASPDRESLLLDSAREFITIGVELSHREGSLSAEDCLTALRGAVGMHGIISDLIPFFEEPCPYSRTPADILHKDITPSNLTLLYRLINSVQGQ